jgi:hypothetical protein
LLPQLLNEIVNELAVSLNDELLGEAFELLRKLVANLFFNNKRPFKGP